MKSDYMAFTAAICAFLTWCAVAQGVSTNGTMLADDLTSSSRVVVDAFENSSNRVHELIQKVSPSPDFSTNNSALVETITETTQYTNLSTKADSMLHAQELSDWTIYRNGSNVTEMVNQPYWYELLWVCGGSMIEGDISPDADVSEPFDSEKLIWHANGFEVTYIATRTCPRGYILGSQSNKVLAAESDITNTVTKSYIESLGIEAGISASTASNISYSVTTNYVDNSLTNRPTKAEMDDGWWGEWEVSGMGDYMFVSITYHDDSMIGGEKYWELTYIIPNDGPYVAECYGDENVTTLTFSVIDKLVTATRHRVAAPVPTKISDLTNDTGYVDAQTVTNMTSLSPVYTQTPTFGEWTVAPSLSGSISITWEPDIGIWRMESDDIGDMEVSSADGENATELLFGGYTATRTRTDIIGYTLGEQTNSILAATNGLVTAEITNGLATASVTNGLIGSDYIATNNAAFVAAVTNCPVVIASANSEALAEWGIYGGGGTIGALLAALAAAVAALKKKKMPLYPVGGTGNPVNATLANGVLTISPFSMAAYTPTASASFSVSIGELPSDMEAGKARDAVLVIDCTSLTDGQEPTLTWDTHYHPRTDTATDLAIVEAGKRAVFYISEYTTGEFAVGGWQETEGGSGT